MAFPFYVDWLAVVIFPIICIWCSHTPCSRCSTEWFIVPRAVRCHIDDMLSPIPLCGATLLFFLITNKHTLPFSGPLWVLIDWTTRKTTMRAIT
ncbi:hypothetical protein EDB86DRAFT_2880592 [Lactarius hatsudake]|nr:hypothetical protein EDB86DRAFT_2880592 [Lactarius hatsudake]